MPLLPASFLSFRYLVELATFWPFHYLSSPPPPCLLQVNGKGVQDTSHEDAASVLKGAGNPVNLVVEYRPSEFREFQTKLQRLADTTPLEPSPTGSPTKASPAKQLYVR